MGQREVRIPDVGQASEVEVIEICVKPGDQVSAEEVLIVLESDKASMEVPTPVAGRVNAIAIHLGDQVDEGDLILTLESDETLPESSADPDAQGQPQADAQRVPRSGPDATPLPAQVPALETDVVVSQLAGARGAERGAAKPDRAEPGAGAGREPVPDGQLGSSARAGRAPRTKVYAGPAVRRMARELGVDLGQLQASGAHGRLTKEDVQAYSRRVMQAAPARESTDPEIPEQDFSRFGPIELIPEGRIRQIGAKGLHRSWVQAPHVTQHEEADVTDLENFRQVQNAHRSADGVKLTLLPFIVRACAHVLREQPRINGSLAAGGKQYVCKQYVHIGIAVDTDEGLIVPVVRDADTKGIRQLAEEIANLAERARSRNLKPQEIQGGSFTVSSLGVLGGLGFTPIIHVPQVAILGVARMAWKQQYDGREFLPRRMLPLSLSYDHRAVNGAEAGRFTTRLAAVLADLRELIL